MRKFKQRYIEYKHGLLFTGYNPEEVAAAIHAFENPVKVEEAHQPKKKRR